VPRVSAVRELLASREDVWSFIAEPHHFSDWWPSIAAVEPDRRGFAPGARWAVHAGGRPTLFRRSGYSGTLIVRAVDRPSRFAWHLTGDRLDAELVLTPTGDGHTRAVLTLEAGWLVGLPRSLPRRALNRLHDLCQTGAPA
jgi:uncharacterized protein YndB with AHSA1/START domain